MSVLFRILGHAFLVNCAMNLPIGINEREDNPKENEMNLKKISAICLVALTLVSCGKDKKDDAPVVTMEGVRMPIPEADPNRPKTGRAALVDVPWVVPSKIEEEDGAFFRPFLHIKGNDYYYSYLCGAVVDGKPKWIKPTAHSPIEWGEGYFELLESDQAKQSVGGWNCTARAFKGVYKYLVLDDGETLKLTFKGNTKIYKILRN